MKAPPNTCPACAMRLPEAAVFCPRCGAATPSQEMGISDSAQPEHRLRDALAERYRLEREIGRGGNAVVYLAQDLRHKRPVAVKVLMSELALSVRASRFLREIEIAAKLNHPHILPLLDSGETDGFLYYVMPYVEGESVRERVRRERQLSIADALQIAREVADALAFAHGRNVVHRDIKPENILLQAGHAVVADFGIARALTAASGQTVTETGMVVGTPTYMSPEQGAGEAYLDGRSDIYSLGCVLYEMLAGHPPFTGASVQEILGRHSLDPVPSLQPARPGVPAALVQAVMRALAKVPADRFATAAEFATALGTAIVQPAARTPGPEPRRFAIRIALAVIGVVVASGVVALAVGTRSRASPAKALEQRQLTFSGDVIEAALSPDGRTMVYVTGPSGARRLMIGPVDGGVSRAIAAHGRISGLSWSADGSQLVFVASHDSGASGGVFLFSLAGGTARRVSDNADVEGLAFSPDGIRLALGNMMEKRIRVLNTITGDTTSFPLAGSFAMLHGIAWSPSARWLALLTVGIDNTIWAIREDGAHQTAVAHQQQGWPPPQWAPGGDAIYYMHDHHSLWKVPFDSGAGRPRGDARPASTDIYWSSTFSVSSNAKRLLYTRGATHSTMWLLTLGGRDGMQTFRKRQLSTGTASVLGEPSISPDGSRIVFASRGGLYVMPLMGTVAEQLRAAEAVSPVFSPDGRTVAFIADTGSRQRVFTVPVTGGTAQGHETTHGMDRDWLAWSPGRDIVYGKRGWRTFDPATGHEGSAFPGFASDSSMMLYAPVPSPDGKRVAFGHIRGGPNDVWVLSLGDSSPVVLHAPDARPIGWSLDNRTVYVFNGHHILEIRVDGGQATPIASWPFAEGSARCGWNIQGHWTVVCDVRDETSDVWLVENFDPGAR